MDWLQQLNIFPDLPVDKNDSEEQLFIKYYNEVDKNAITEKMRELCVDNDRIKNTNKSILMRKWGNEAYYKKDFEEAFQYYNKSIIYANRDSIEFAQSAANRSVLLHTTGRYEACLKDIEIVLNSEYPREMRYKIYFRQSQCYVELKKYLQAKKSMDNALVSATEYLTELELSILNEKITKLHKQISDQKKINPKEPNEFEVFVIKMHKRKFQPNPKYLNASLAIKTTGYPKKIGNSVIANKDIKKGEILFEDIPYVFVFVERDQNDFDICAHCLSKTGYFVACNNCISYVYCSDKCRYEDWNLSHRWRCLGERTKLLKGIETRLSLSFLFQASREMFDTKVNDVSVFKKDDCKYAFVNKFSTNKDHMDSKELLLFVKHAVWIVLYLINCTDYFHWLFLQPNRPEGNMEQLHNFVGGNLIKYMMQLKYHGAEIRDSYVRYDITKVAELYHNAIGWGLYMSSNLMKHSCIPNTVQCFDNVAKIVRAIKDIPKGTEITFDYCANSYKLQELSKRKELLKNLNITCDCAMCTDPQFPESQHPFLCPRCKGKMYRLPNKMTVKCKTCDYSGCANEYLKNSNKVSQLLMFFKMTGDYKYLDLLHDIIKKTYHPHSVSYFSYYGICLTKQLSQSNFKKTLDFLKQSAEILKVVYGDINEQYLWAIVSYTHMLAKTTSALHPQHKNYKKLIKEIKYYLKDCLIILEYFVCPENIKIFLAYINSYLKFENSTCEEILLQDFTDKCIVEDLEDKF